MTSNRLARQTPALSSQVAVGPRVIQRGRAVHLVRDRRTGGEYLVGDREAFVICRLDGTETFDRIAEQYQTQFGRVLGERAVDQLLGLLYSRRLLDLPGEPPEQRDAALAELRERNRVPDKSSWLARRFPLVDPSRVITAVLRRAPWLVSTQSALLTGVLSAAVVVVSGVQVPALWDAAADRWSAAPVVAATVLAVTMVVSLVVHEFAHGVVGVALGGECGEMGVAWRFPLVTAYTKVSGVFLLPRQHRAAVALFGAAAGLVVLVPVAVPLVVAPRGPVYGYAAISLLLGVPAALVSFLPVLRLDGQRALSHVLGVWDVATESGHWWRGAVRRVVTRGRAPQPPSHLAGLAVVGVAGYGLLVAVGVGFTVVAGVGWLWGAVGAELSVVGWVVVAVGVIVGCAFLTVVRRIWNKSNG